MFINSYVFGMCPWYLFYIRDRFYTQLRVWRVPVVVSNNNYVFNVVLNTEINSELQTQFQSPSLPRSFCVAMRWPRQLCEETSLDAPARQN